MKVWLDAHLSPAIAKFLNEEFNVEAYSLRGLGLRNCEDDELFNKAKKEDVIFVTKDEDFLDLLDRFGSPPKIIWLRVGNTSNDEIRKVFRNSWDNILKLLDAGNDLIEITNL